MLSAQRLAIVIATVLLTSTSLAKDDQVDKAEQVAKAWLELVDRSSYGESYDQAATFFKNAVTKEQWQKSLEVVRGPLGKVLSRQIKSAKYVTELPGAPDGTRGHHHNIRESTPQSGPV